MLRRVAPDEVRLGMYIHGFEGSWLSHPFWRSRFLLRDPMDLAKVRESDVAAVVIDERKGLAAPRAVETPVFAAARPRTPRPEALRRRASPSSWRPAPADRSRASRLATRSQRVMRQVLDGARLGRAIRTAEVVSLVDDIAASVQANPRLFIGIVRLKSKDEYTYLHSVAVCALMVNLARQANIDPALHQSLGVAGLLHDVGKMCMPDTILNKAGSLDEAEFALMREHPERGHALLLAGEAVPEQALDVCRHHHERVDGTGYPFGLRGEEISLAARMGAICDVYDALTSERAYKRAWSPLEAVTAMSGWSGQFDRTLLFEFFRSIGVFPVGLLVRLRSNRLAVVLDNGRRASRPRVRAFYLIMDRATAKYEDVTIADDLSGDQIVGEEEPASWGFRDWAGMRELIVRGCTLD